MENNESALSPEAWKWINEISKADILVGIPTYNNVLTASYVIGQVVKGLDAYFPYLKSAIFVSDGKSADGTLSSVKTIHMPSEIKLIPAIYIGASGKGSAVKAIFEAADCLNAKSVALVDSDLRSIKPEWMNLMITPTLTGASFVVPFYNRRKYDGTITNFLCYPVTASLYGKDIRQPIGGDFGVSIDLVRELLKSPMWSESTDVCRFGIDIFETHTALAKGFKVVQSGLGVKNHDPKDPSSQLTSMFRQVMSTMFECIEKYEDSWKKTRGISPVEIVGEEKFVDVPEAIPVSFENTLSAFKDNFDKYFSVYSNVLEKDILNKFKELENLAKEDVEFTTETWAKTVYSFIAKFNKTPKDKRIELIDALRPLWIGRVAVFIKKTWDLHRDEAEKLIAEEAKVFEKLKPYFLEKYFDKE